MSRLTVFAVFVSFLSCVAGASAADEPLDFARDIRPILSNSCFACHGPSDKSREAGIRFDTRKGLEGTGDSGEKLIVPGHSEESELYRRLTAEEEYERMPPADSGRTITKKQIALIKRWIDEGARGGGHWAFQTIERPKLPAADIAGGNAIDKFVLDRLAREGRDIAPRADKETLIRRVTYDLTGLPPTVAEIDAFLADDGADAYDRLVDRLLESPRYGEHMTRYWLDAARYGDTHGLHLDNVRSIWPYRDWLIEAFNDNMPFDQFTIEQIAGDLLPNATVSQKVATGFNRCNVTTSEGGAIAEEFRVRYAVDRVEAIGTVWMGLTLGCAVCHEHKFDPISQTEFYQFFAYYNNLTERAMDGNALLPPPSIQVPSPEQAQRKKELEEAQAKVARQIRDYVASIDYKEPENPADANAATRRDTVWFDDELPGNAQVQASGTPPKWVWVTAPEHPVYSGEKATMRTAEGMGQHFFNGVRPGLKVGAGDHLFCYVYLDPDNPPKEIMLQWHDGGGWEHRAYWGGDHIEWGQNDSASRLHMGPLPETGKWVRLEVDAQQVGFRPGREIRGWAFTQYDGTVYWDQAGLTHITRQYNSLAAWEEEQRKAKKSTLPKHVQDAIKRKAPKEGDEKAQQEHDRLAKVARDYFLENVYSGARETLEPLQRKQDRLKNELAELNKQIPSTLIMQDAPKKRDCYVLIRGEYDKPDKDRKVEPGVPGFLPPLPEDAPPNRLALARWLVDPRHPLTARVTVNRFWQQKFGVGLVKTAEDFGSQGEQPVYRELLDWLAAEFIESGWDVKHIQKLIVTSRTYQQSSKVTPEDYARDPENRLLARGPRFRMDAEMIRDTALAVSGLLTEKLGGPSVKPYQPAGLWKAVGYTDSNTANFKQDSGPRKLYRRSMYIFWKRTSPPPTMSALDAPTREACTVRRARTNTPLQALALMNNKQYVEASRHFAQRILAEGGETADQRATFAFRAATSRTPTDRELSVLRRVFAGHLAHYRANPEEATKLIDSATTRIEPVHLDRDKSQDVELAAWTMVANMILNLDETMTKG